MTIEIILDGRRYYVFDLTAERLFYAYYGQSHVSDWEYAGNEPFESLPMRSGPINQTK